MRALMKKVPYLKYSECHFTASASKPKPSGNPKKKLLNHAGIDRKVQALCELGHLKEAVDNAIRHKDNSSYSVYAYILDECIKLKEIAEGKRLYHHMMEIGYPPDAFLGTKLLILYTKCRCLEDACQLFDKMPERNVASWITMIAGYAQNGDGGNALALFQKMQQAGIKPNQFLFPSVLRACAGLTAMEQGKQFHGYVIKSGFRYDMVVGNSIIDMYVKCRSLSCARDMFDEMSERNVVSWTSMIEGNAKCGNLDAARQLFDKMPEKNVVSWTAIMAGYAQLGYGEEALGLFYQMKQLGVEPDQLTFASVLQACACSALLSEGKQVHVHVIRSGFEWHFVLATALVDMYAKCGRIEDSHRIFDSMSARDVVAWNAMIAGYGKHGYARKALQLYEQMRQSGIRPTRISFTNVLSACSHAGLVDEGCYYFNSMTQDYNITAEAEQYACMVDLLGRAGRLDEALAFIQKMPIEPTADVWGALLASCRIHGNMWLGKLAAEWLFKLRPDRAGTYVALSNIYSAAGRWDEAAKLRRLMNDRGIKKEPGYSWVQVKNRVHTFSVGDTSHPQIEHIYAMLDKLAGQMKTAGHVPNTNFALHDVDDEQKEHMLYHHSEKLAIAFSLISTPPGTSIQIVKNLRICVDCHTAAKFISKIVGREIVIRDANRFHHFKDGLCSCGDYW